MAVPTLVTLCYWEVANDPRWNLCTAYEQFLALFDNGVCTDEARTFFDKFLELQVQRRLVWHGDHYIRRSESPSDGLRHLQTSRDGATGRRNVRRANART
jgi:hypothetical protein